MWGTKWILFYNEIVYLHIKMTLKDYLSEDVMDFRFDHKFQVRESYVLYIYTVYISYTNDRYICVHLWI